VSYFKEFSTKEMLKKPRKKRIKWLMPDSDASSCQNNTTLMHDTTRLYQSTSPSTNFQSIGYLLKYWQLDRYIMIIPKYPYFVSSSLILIAIEYYPENLTC